jgi:hypothetical protein
MYRIGNTLMVMRTRPACKISVETSENKQLGKFMHRWDVHIKVDFKARGCEDINRIWQSHGLL